MSDAIYRHLARHLDNLPGGFPATESGVEQRILRRLFSPDDAALALHLTLIPEPAEAIAGRAGIDSADAAARLEDMAGRGLIFRVRRGGQALYQATQYVIGIWEFQLNRLDPGLIQDMEEYLPTLFRPEEWSRGPQLRVIPVGESVPVPREVLPYEDAAQIIRANRRIAVAPCICRRERGLSGQTCEHPLETCLTFGWAADYYVENGMGRRISADEALEILARAEQSGLVLQPGGSQQPGNICCCCACCCRVLEAYRRHPQPADLVATPFAVHADAESCVGCGECLERCPMEALSLVDERVASNPERCIGCGQCTTVCPLGCLELVRKPEPLQPRVPRDSVRAAVKLALARGKALPLAGHSLRAGVSRLKGGSW